MNERYSSEGRMILENGKPIAVGTSEIGAHKASCLLNICCNTKDPIIHAASFNAHRKFVESWI